MLDPTKIAIRATTQEHLDIEDIKDDLVILKDGSSCLVVGTTAINFGLLSEKEQEATIYAYAGLLNSLTFSIQLVIRSQEKDVSSYIKLLDEAELKEKKQLIKEQIRKYKEFIRETVQKNEVLDKKFYIVIPMSAIEVGITKGITAAIKPHKGLPFEKSYILEKAKLNLYPKRDHLLRLLARIGLKGHQLTTQELIQLFFNIYNPETIGQQVAGAKQYEATFVQPITSITTATKKETLPPPPTVTKESVPNNPLPVSNMPRLPEKPIQQTVIQPEIKPREETIQDQINNLVRDSVKE